MTDLQEAYKNKSLAQDHLSLMVQAMRHKIYTDEELEILINRFTYWSKVLNQANQIIESETTDDY